MLVCKFWFKKRKILNLFFNFKIPIITQRGNSMQKNNILVNKRGLITVKL